MRETREIIPVWLRTIQKDLICPKNVPDGIVCERNRPDGNVTDWNVTDRNVTDRNVLMELFLTKIK